LKRESSDKKKILIVDDSLLVRSYVSKILSDAGFNVYEAQNGEEALRVLEKIEIDLLILDIVLPDLSGFDILKEIRKKEEMMDLPVIIITSQAELDERIKGLSLGADDYLIKPFEPLELIARVRVQLRAKELRDQLKEAQRRLYDLSITDELTGLYNRRYFFKRLKEEVRRATRHNYELSISIADIDHFKRINDEFGHEFGDIVLKEIAEVLKKNVREEDVAARYGGDEFVFLLPYTDRESARIQAERIRAEVENLFFKRGNTILKVGISIGIASYFEDGCSSPESVLEVADRRLYIAKSLGRGKVVASDKVLKGGTP